MREITHLYSKEVVGGEEELNPGVGPEVAETSVVAAEDHKQRDI
jgi:hypothetical protein